MKTNKVVVLSPMKLIKKAIETGKKEIPTPNNHISVCPKKNQFGMFSSSFLDTRFHIDHESSLQMKWISGSEHKTEIACRTLAIPIIIEAAPSLRNTCK